MSVYLIHVSTLKEVGPIIELKVWMDSNREAELRRKGMTVPEPLLVRALIDTGTARTVFREEILRKLRLPKKLSEKVK